MILHILKVSAEISDNSEIITDCQISPIFEDAATMSELKYELAFVAEVPAFGTATYSIQYLKTFEELQL